jgi:magnesium transporter
MDHFNHSQQTTPNIFTKKFFCTALIEENNVVTKEAETLEELKEIFSRSLITWIDFRTDDFQKEGKQTAKELGFNELLTLPLFKEKLSTYQDLDSEFGFVLPAVSVENLIVRTSPLIVFVKKGLIFTVHKSKTTRFIQFRRYAEPFFKKISSPMPEDDKLTTVLIRLIDENNSRNFEKLRQIEEQSDKLNEWFMNPDTPVFKIGPEIHKMKHALLVYLRLLWATGDVLNTLRYGDAELVSDKPELLDRLTGLAQDINGHVALTEHLSNVLTSGLEVLQSIYNNQLQTVNNRLALLMSYLTIVGTAVLVPNTLGTILSGSAFNLQPSDLWWYSLLLIGSTVISTWGVYIMVKRKGWIPGDKPKSAPTLQNPQTPENTKKTE